MGLNQFISRKTLQQVNANLNSKACNGGARPSPLQPYGRSRSGWGHADGKVYSTDVWAEPFCARTNLLFNALNSPSNSTVRESQIRYCSPRENDPGVWRKMQTLGNPGSRTGFN